MSSTSVTFQEWVSRSRIEGNSSFNSLWSQEGICVYVRSFIKCLQWIRMNHLSEYSLLGSETCVLNRSTIQRVGSGWGTDPSVVTLQSRGAVASQEWPGQDAICSAECFQDWLSMQGTVVEHISPAFPRMGSPASSAAPHLTVMSYTALRTWDFPCSPLVEAQAILCSFSEKTTTSTTSQPTDEARHTTPVVLTVSCSVPRTGKCRVTPKQIAHILYIR